MPDDLERAEHAPGQLTVDDALPRPRLLSLFSGYGGLDLAAAGLLGADVIAHAEVDAAACTVLARRFPGVPNLGDVSAIDWPGVGRRLGPVDVITGGFPCQDVSLAGRRLGIAHDTRSGLWAHMAAAVDALRPRLVVIENVRGLLSARARHPAHSDVEPCPWCLGGPDEVSLRALGAVLGDLSDLGYDAAWQLVRAADVGAPHGRARVFVLAWPAADTGCGGRRPDVVGVRAGKSDTVGGAAADAERGGRDGRPGAPGPGRWAEPAHGSRRTAAHAERDGRPGWRPGAAGTPDIRRPGPRAPAAGRGPGAAADPDGDGRGRLGGIPAGRDAVRGEDGNDADRRGGDGAAGGWGPYGPAVARWAAVLGRSAPPPTVPGNGGAGRLSPVFVEWMMGLPAGWVTAVPGIGRNDALRLLGNGVVPQQAAAAVAGLLRAAGGG